MSLKRQLKGIIPEHARSSLSDRFDVIGDIAVLSLPKELRDYRCIIADTIVSSRHNIRTVLNKISPVNGIDRTADFEVLAGTDTITIHKEYGFSYRLDVGTVFFNPRMASEHKRVTDLVRPGECVLVPFCGIGPFVIPAAHHGARIIAIEQNPEACRWFIENVALNGVEERVTLITGDAFDTSMLPYYSFDRAIIPTPYGKDSVFDRIALRVKPGGMIHFYTFCNSGQSDALGTAFVSRDFEPVVKRRCGNVAPGISRWVYDLKKGRGNIKRENLFLSAVPAPRAESGK